MKKIRCDWYNGDFLKLEVVDYPDVIVTVSQNGQKSKVRINSGKIRKLREQLKRALMKIEGVSDESP